MQIVWTRLPSQAIDSAVCNEEKRVTYNFYINYHLHHGLTQEKMGNEEVRLTPLAPLSASMLQQNNLEKLFHNSVHNVSGSGDPDSSLFRSLPLPRFS